MLGRYATILALMLAIVLSLASCAKSNETSAEDYSTVETPTAPITPPSTPETPKPPPPPEDSEPASEPEMNWEDRNSFPSLLKLVKNPDGSYTDGLSRTFIIDDDGTVTISFPPEAANASIYGPLVLEPKTLEGHSFKAYNYWAMHDERIPEDILPAAYEAIGLKYDADDPNLMSIWRLIHIDGEFYYLYWYHPGGGGSGESYYCACEARIVKINRTTGDAVNFGSQKAVHIVLHEGYFYYVELVCELLGTAGTGPIMRIDMDGKNKKVILDEIVYGPFQIVNDRVYYSSLSDGMAYSASIYGGDKTPVGSRIVPNHHRVSLEFYGDLILNRHYVQSGFTSGIFTYVSDYTTSAIMGSHGRDLITFPNSLWGEDAFDVINWGGEDYHMATGYYYLLLRSNTDQSYWVYSRWNFNIDMAQEAYEFARWQYEDKRQ